MRIGFLVCALLALPLHAAAQTGEMWELTSQMNIPGMPAGMGAQTSRVCQGDDPERAKAAEKDKEQCKVTEKKNTATRTQITMVCKSGTLTIDQQYNAGRTEFKSTMTMKSKDGDFTMNMTGKKVGACDAVAERKAQDAKVDDMKKQMAAAQAQGAAAMKQESDNEIKQCNAALEKMDFHGFGMHGGCYKRTDGQCATYKDMYKSFPESAKACNANIAEFCKRFQTADGFIKAKGDENAAAMCGVSTKAIKAAQCPRAEKAGSLAFLGAYCPAEAKPLAEAQCTGRDYTSKLGGKYAAFCVNYLANADFEKRGRQRPAYDRGTDSSQSQQEAAPPASEPASTTDQVKQGVSKGLDKLKGLFGR